MKTNSGRRAGRHILQIPGPTPVPERIRQAINMPVIDHRGLEFKKLAQRIQYGLRTVFRCSGPVIVYPASGTGAWEACLVNTLSPGDRVLMYETGHFSNQWFKMAERLSVKPKLIPSDWRRGADPAAIELALQQDDTHEIKAVCVVHNETSTGAVSDIAAIRRAIDRSGHSALFFVDTISSLGSMDYRHDEWRVDVTVAGSQKGLMLPPGLSFNAVSEKAIAASRQAGLARSYWDWADMLAFNAQGFFPYTPAISLLAGLAEALDMLSEEGLESVFARHRRLGEATRRAVRGWGLEVLCADPAAYSSTLTGVVVPRGHSADRLRGLVLEHFDCSLGAGLGKFADQAFRIGHLGDVNDLEIIAALAGTEMGLQIAGVPHRIGGVQDAMVYLTESALLDKDRRRSGLRQEQLS